MNQLRFEEENAHRWQETELLVSSAEDRHWKGDLERLPALFRQLCADLALAQHRTYGSKLCGRLNRLVLRARNVLSPGASGEAGRTPGMLFSAFPRAVRREWRLVTVHMLIFWVPFFAFIAAAHYNERWIFAVLDDQTMAGLDEMYGRETGGGLMRDKFSQDFSMFAFYIQHNIGIGLRTIAGGVLAGIGSVFSVALQGVLLGASFGYVHYSGNTDRFYAFVAGHSSLELMGLIFCGVAGTKLGMAVISPGRLSRAEALKDMARQVMPIIYGGPFLVLMAAFVEGFWSAGPAPAELKLTVGAVLWLLLAAWILLAGRGAQHEA